MKTLCPTCKTRYDIDPKALLGADGVARCFRCGTVFDVVSEDASAPGATYAVPVQNAVVLDSGAEQRQDDEDAGQAHHPDASPATGAATGEADEVPADPVGTEQERDTAHSRPSVADARGATGTDSEAHASRPGAGAAPGAGQGG